MKATKYPYSGMPEGPTREIVEALFHIARREHRQYHDVCEDLVECAFTAIAQAVASPERRAALEERYMVVARRRPDDVRAFPNILALLSRALAGLDCDPLGDVFTALAVFSEGMGQFMTPWSVGSTIARITLADRDRARPFLTLCEPACGTGGLVLAAAAAIKADGDDPSTVLHVTAIDRSPLMYRSAFVQLALAGLAGSIVLGDALHPDPTDESAVLPATVAFLDRHGATWREYRRAGIEPQAARLPEQLTLL